MIAPKDLVDKKPRYFACGQEGQIDLLLINQNNWIKEKIGLVKD